MAQPPSPHRPTHLPEYSEACLQALVEQSLADKISLGGAFGLLHYFDYRPTHDVDAWWTENITVEDQQRVTHCLEGVLRQFGTVKIRAWGDVTSIELQRGGKTVFSFQIARRSALLEPPAPAPWSEVLLDSFSDLVAGKMVALIERGAPRDFRDIYAICNAGLITPRECWTLWTRRQQAAQSDVNYERADLAIETHLARIAQHRRLEQIADRQQQQEAERVRSWFTKEFLHARS